MNSPTRADFKIPTQADIEDDMEKIHALHLAHGNTRHCNYCNCECALCKSEGWKYRPEPYEAEVLEFKKGEVLKVVASFNNGDSVSVGYANNGGHGHKGDRAVYMGHRGFRMLSGVNKGALVTFFANRPCAHYFQRINSSK